MASGSNRDLARLITDNDVRALFYERLARGVEVMLSPGSSKGPSVRYVGGCLRSPVLLARADTHVIAPAAELELQRLWASVSPREEVADFPFWMDAVLWRARDGDAKAVQAVIRELRQEGKAFRSKRATVESRLRAGDPDSQGELLQLLKGEMPRLGPVGQLTDAGRAVAKIVLPPCQRRSWRASQAPVVQPCSVPPPDCSDPNCGSSIASAMLPPMLADPSK